MLYLETAEGFVPWTGQPINGIVYSRDIAGLWPSEELANLGLYQPTDPGIPAGTRTLSRTVERIDGVVTLVYETEPILPTIADVHAERDRRLAVGFDHDLGGGRGVHHFRTTPADMLGWDEVSKLAQALLNLGQTEQLITVATGTGVTQITPVEWQGVLVAAAAFRQPIWGASFVLEQMDPIPADFADNAYW